MANLWVKLKPYNAVKVSTEGCDIVDDFIEEVKKKLLFLYGHFPNGEPSLSLTDGGPALRPGLKITDIPSQSGYCENDDEHPLFITVTGFKSAPARESSKNDLFVASSTSLLTEEEDVPHKRQRIEITDLTTQLQSFANAQLVDEGLQSPNDVFLPYPQNEIKKIYVRKCYRDVFDLLLKSIKMKSFAISGTPGIGKSVFFVYILYRLMKDFEEKTLSLRPNRIVYQRATEYTCFNLENQTAVELEHLEAKALVRQQDTLYIIDGQTTPMSSSCIALFISSPRSQQYKEFVKQKMAKQWYFPVWTLEELQSCQSQCYSDLSIEILKERYRVYGGVARLVFYRDYSIIVPNIMEEAIMFGTMIE